MSPLNIILVEDDAGHATLIKKNLRRCGMDRSIMTFEDGRNAVQYLSARENTDTAVPCLVLVDLNLPGMNGYQVLRALRENPATHHMVVGILTTAGSRGDVERCYEMGCNFYLTKPSEYDHFSAVIQNLGTMLSMLQVPEGKHAQTANHAIM